MARTIPANILSNIQANDGENAFLIEILTSTPIRVTDAGIDLTYSSNTYSTGELISFSLPTESFSLNTGASKISLAGANVNNIINLLSDSQRKIVNIYLVSISAGTVDTAMVVYSGEISNVTTNDNATSGKNTVDISVVSEFDDFDRVRGHITSNSHQERNYSNDKTFEFVVNAESTGRFDSIPLSTQNRNIGEGLFGFGNAVATEQASLPIVYGIDRIKCYLVYEHIAGGFGGSVTSTQAFVFGDGEHETITDILIGGVSYTDASMSPYVTLKDTVTGALSGYQSTHLEGLPGSAWTTSHRFKGAAGVVLEFIEDDIPWKETGYPQIEAIVQGRKILNLSTSVTEYSSNPAWIIYDYLTTKNGFDMSTSFLDSASFITAAALFDTITPHGEKFKQFSGSIDTTKEIGKNLQLMLNEFESSLVWVNGIYEFIVDKDSVSSFAFDHTTNANIISSISIDNGGSRKKFNTIESTFRSSNSNFVITTQSTQDATYFSADGEELLQKVKYLFSPYKYQVDLNVKFKLDQSRNNIMVKFTSPISAYENVVGDVVTITESDRGWSSKKFRIVSVGLNADYTVDVVLKEHTSSNYVLVAQSTINDPTNNVINNSLIVAAPANLVVSTDLAYNLPTETSVITRAYLTWTTPTSAAKIVSFEVQYKLSSDVLWLAWDIPKNLFSFVNVQPAMVYDFRVRSINSFGSQSSWTTTSNTLIPQYETIVANDIPIMSGLRVENGTSTTAGIFEFFGNDIKLLWQPASGVTVELDDDIPADENVKDYWFAGYRIEIYDGTTTLARFETTDEFLTLSADQIDELGKLRSYTIKGWVRTVHDQVSTAPMVIQVENPLPELPTELSVVAGFNKITIDFIPPTDIDYVGLNAYVSTSSGFTLSGSNLADTAYGQTKQIQIEYLTDGSQIQTGVQYFVRVVPFDAYGVVLTNSSSEFLVKTQKSAEDKKNGLSPWATQIDPAGETFIRSVLEGDAIPSEFIANLTVAKLLSGIINATVAIDCQGLITAYGTGTSFAQLGLDPSDNAMIKANNGTIDTFVVDADGDATFAGSLSAATGTFAGSLSAATGTFSGDISAASGTFGGSMDFTDIIGGTKPANNATLNQTDSYLLSQDNMTDGVNYKRYSAADLTKLSGVAATADVTANVIAAGLITAGSIEILTNGEIYSGKTTFSAPVSGWFLGKNSSGVHQFKVGVNESFLGFDGTEAVLGNDTKLIGADAYANDSIYWNTYFDTIDAFYANLIQPSLDQLNGGITVATGTTGSDICRVRKFIQGGIPEADFAKNMRFKTFVSLTTSTGQDAYVMVGHPNDGFGFYNDGANVWKAYAAKAASISKPSTGVTISGTQKLEAVYDVGTNIKYYIDGVLKTTINTNLPTATGSPSIMRLETINNSVTTSITLKAFQYKFQQDE